MAVNREEHEDDEDGIELVQSVRLVSAHRVEDAAERESELHAHDLCRHLHPEEGKIHGKPERKPEQDLSKDDVRDRSKISRRHD